MDAIRKFDLVTGEEVPPETPSYDVVNPATQDDQWIANMLESAAIDLECSDYELLKHWQLVNGAALLRHASKRLLELSGIRTSGQPQPSSQLPSEPSKRAASPSLPSR